METARTAQFRNGAVGGGHIAESARLASHRYPPPRGTSSSVHLIVRAPGNALAPEDGGMDGGPTIDDILTIPDHSLFL